MAAAADWEAGGGGSAIDQPTNPLLFPRGFGDLVARRRRWVPGGRERERSGEVGSAGQVGRGEGGRRRHGSLAIWETRGQGKGDQWGRKEGEG